MATDFTNTLNLPATEFSMRANLPAREPETLAYWQQIGLYRLMLENAAGKPTFELHDGLPFSNGNIHMGTALNKVLKDFINKSKTMEGYRVPYVPGWDNHGMPIESAIIKQNKLDRRKMSIPEFRSACHKFAQKYVDVQKGQFVRLGVSGDWEHPYLTMNPAFEAREVRVFGEMYRKGTIYKGMKPAYWCPKCETALAEAEIEYKTDAVLPFTSSSASATTSTGVLRSMHRLPTPTSSSGRPQPGRCPATLPLRSTRTRSTCWSGRLTGRNYIVAEALCEKTMQAGGVEVCETLASWKGSSAGVRKTAHPFLDRDSVVVLADYVTMDSGTGCVHTAPGFGADDFQTCKRYGMDIVVPVDDRGRQTEDAGKYAGLFYADSNAVILEDMKEIRGAVCRRGHDARVPALLALQKPHHFPRDATVVLLGGRLQGRGGRGVPQRALAARVGRGAHDPDGAGARRLVYFAPASLGSADPRVLLRSRCGSRSAPRRRLTACRSCSHSTVPTAGLRWRCPSSAGGLRLPALRRSRIHKGNEYTGRLV